MMSRMPTRMRLRWSTALPTISSVALALALAGIAIADTRGPRPVLHEDLAPPNGDKPSPTIADADGAQPKAFQSGSKVLVKPSLDPDPNRSHDEPVLQSNMDRETSDLPGRNTGPDDTLHYVSVFNPDVLPFKRMSALDGVAGDYRMVIAHKAETDVPVGGTSDKTRDRFWGSVLVKLSPGSEVPLPSVAPDMRILSYEVNPKIPLRFSKDGADNFYVRSDESSASGTYRLVFLCDADAGYFAPALPSAAAPGGFWTPRKILAQAPPELRPSLPASVLAAARRTHQTLAIDPDTEINVAFNALVRWFRGFSAKQMPPSTGDIYRDLCDSQAGVCRHRAFAFMITANALGIPTRYVSNEAHAFVEVWFPGRKWQRIDLGGAALRMDVTGADNKTLHRPRADDPFAKPQQYSQNYTQLEGEIKGLTKQQIDDKHKSLDQEPPSGAFGNNGGGPTANNNTGQDRLVPTTTAPAVSYNPKKQAVQLTVTSASERAYRGNTVHIEGQANSNGKGIADHVIEVFLVPPGSDGANHVSLGTALTGPDGSFKVDLTVPGMKLAVYDVILMTSEDAYYNAARSD